MGTLDSPTSDLEYDIALAQSFDGILGGTFYMDAMRTSVSNGYYNRGSVQELSRDFVYQGKRLTNVYIYYGYVIDSGMSADAANSGGGNGYSEALYLANTINSLYDENATRNLKALEREAQAWKNVARKVPGRINKAMDANKFTKVITKSVGKKLYGVGLVFSAVDMYQDPSASNIAWNVADNLVGLAAFVPGLQVPALIYFTARISYDVYDAYNEP